MTIADGIAAIGGMHEASTTLGKRRSDMKSHRLPFENRWTNATQAWQWYCELERLGESNVRAMLADHETHHADEPAVVFDIPAGLVRDWLAYRDRRTTRRQTLYQATVIVLALIAATAALITALRT